jgi:DNA-binding MarR family transcriptional regulator
MDLEKELPGNYRNDYHKGLINLLFTASCIGDDIKQLLKEHGLTSQQYNILRVLRRYNEEEVNLNFLRHRMLDRHSDVSRIVNKLYQKRLISRKENKSDRRNKSLKITEKGLKLLDKLEEIRSMEDRFLSHLEKSEIQELNRLLDKSREMPSTRQRKS